MIILITPPSAAFPKSEAVAPLTISIRSTFSTASLAMSSLPAIRPTCGSPSTRISTYSESSPWSCTPSPCPSRWIITPAVCSKTSPMFSAPVASISPRVIRFVITGVSSKRRGVFVAVTTTGSNSTAPSVSDVSSALSAELTTTKASTPNARFSRIRKSRLKVRFALDESIILFEVIIFLLGFLKGLPDKDDGKR